MSSFEQLYQGLFPRAQQDKLSNYAHVRLIKARTHTNATQIDLVRPILGPVTRQNGSDLCILKCIPVPIRDPAAQTLLLKEVAIHRAVTLGFNSTEDRTLPLYSHFIGPSTFDQQERSRNSNSTNLYLFLVLPYCQRGSLFDYLSDRLATLPYSGRRRDGILTESELRWTIGEVVKAMQRCHERGVVHRDIKAENILLWESGSQKKAQRTQKLLLCDFGLSKWLDEEGPEEVRGDSTLCGTWDYMSPETVIKRRTGPAVDVWALGCLCVFLLTGNLPFAASDQGNISSSSDVRVKEVDSIRDRIERLAIGDWEETRAKLPAQLSYECRSLLEGMLLLDECHRLNTKQILSHPFMRSDLPFTSLGPKRLLLSDNSKPSQAPSTKTKSERRQRISAPKVSPQIGNDSSGTTLRSVMQRTSPEMFLTTAEGSIEKRRTPFGVLHLPKHNVCTETDRQKTTSGTTFIRPVRREAWGNGYGTQGLVNVRQRIVGGKIEISREGKVIVATEQAAIAISTDGNQISLLQAVDRRQSEEMRLQIDELYDKAAKWLVRHRQRSTLAGFILPAVLSEKLDSKKRGAAEYIAYCSVKGNGPLPDYQVRFATVEGNTQGLEQRMEEWNVEIQVDVQRGEERLKVKVKLQGTGKSSDTSWKECILPLKTCPNIDANNTRWTLASTLQSSLIVRDLSTREQRAIERSLEAAASVDLVFKTLIQIQTIRV